MNGSVKKDPNGKTWGYVFDAPRRPGARRRQIRKRGFASKREAERTLRDHLALVEASFDPLGSGEALSEFLFGYIEGLDGIAPSTKASYEAMVATHVAAVPEGRRPLNALGPVDVEAILAAARHRPGRHGKPLSSKTLRNLFVFLNSALSYAVATGRIVANPMSGLRAPQVRRDPETMKFWTPDQARQFIDSTTTSSDPVIGWIVMLAILTGMRRGEIAGLRWSDVDLERQTLSIAHTRITVHNKVISGPPKTDRSRRTLKLSAAHIDTLAAVRARQDGDALLFGEHWEDSGFIFTTDHGRPLEPDSVSKRFQRAVEAAGFKVIRFHDLRHTHASIAINGGEHIKAVSARLGHADIGFTLRQYTHLMPEHQGLPADGVAAALFDNEDSCDQTCDQSVEGKQKAPSGKGA